MSSVIEHIEERNGGLYVKGKRISVDSIVYAFRNGASPENIQERFYTLTLNDVYGVISYYLDHRQEVDGYLRREEERVEMLRNQAGPPHIDLEARAKARSLAQPAPK